MPTREFTAQADWNMDIKADLDPAKTNYYSIRHNGTIEYYVQDEKTGEDVLVHVEQLPNTRTAPIFGNPSFRLTWSVINFGNTTPLSIYGGHSAGFIEGIKKLRPPTFSEEREVTSVGTTLTNILTIRNREVFGTKVNLGRIIPDLATAFSESTKASEVEIIEDATFSGPTDYSYEDEQSSIAEIDATANTITGEGCWLPRCFAQTQR